MGSFKDVVGHKDIIKYIGNAVMEDRVSHAYILNGERGSGKKMLASLFAMTLLCEKHRPDPCNECHSCIQAESGNHPDIIRVTHEKPNTISVDDIREQVNNTIDIKPYQGLYKIYIIPEADRMTAQAQNALLKTIEEPPKYAVIFLLTEKYIHEMELSEIVNAVNHITVYKLEISDYLDLIMIWYRDVLMYKATKELDKVVFKDQIQYIKEQARRSSYEGIELILESLEKAKARLKANVNFELVMELLFLTIKEN